MPEAENELERVYTVPLSRAWIAPRHRRVVRAVNVLREFAEHHMKSEEIKIDSELNETLWKRGITRPPRRITVKMTKDEDGLVTISLPEKEEELGEVNAEETTPITAETPKAPKEEKQESKPAPKEASGKAKSEVKPEPQKKAQAKKKPAKAVSGGRKKEPSKKQKGSKKK
ncbi:MAG: 50S ribosomal protein L31e [Nitrososphaerales archaeon]